MSEQYSLIEAMRMIVPQKGYNEFVYAIVRSVNEQAKTFDAVNIADDENIFIDVKLRIYEGGDEGNYAIPTVGSKVLLGCLSKEECHLIHASEVSKMVIGADTIIINGGQFGGLVIWDNLKVQLEKINLFMQAIMGVMAAPTIPEAGNSAPSAFHAAMKAALSAVQVPQYTNITNDNIKH